jgi:excisionase family DNA binding protein
VARSESEFGKGTSFDWPQLLTTPRAALYTGCSKWAILRAVRSGQLTIAGRRGRVFIFRRADLEQWLTGTNDDGAPLATITPIAAARLRAPLSDSLARIRRGDGRGDGQ